MIIDCHVHIFHHLGGACGYDSVETHMRYLKGSHSCVVRRKRDGAIITQPFDWNQIGDFRAERFGRYEWTFRGEAYYVQQFSPSLQTMESSPEFILAHMDYVGVDVAVLQHDAIYGRYNEFFAETVEKYPGRFIGLTKIEETQAYTPVQLRELHRCAEELGLRGVFFQQAAFGEAEATAWCDSDVFAPFWEAVRRLGLVVYLQMRDYWAIARLARRYPDIQFITLLPQGRLSREGKVRLADSIMEVMSLPNILFEICPISYGFLYEYPYREMHPIIRPLYEEFGGSKFCWGSDMPNLERFCTYLQGLDFLRRHCDFISKDDMKLILGGNLARLFNLPDH